MSPSEKIEMTSSEGIAQQFYSPWEGDSAISSWNDAIAAITEICKLCDAENVNIRTLAWRGQADSSWSLHSSLYRHLNTEKEWGKPPEEEHLLKYEKAVLEFVREGWRDSHIPYLELLAQLQHHGAPTRLIDVSLNPLVALWFAVEPAPRGENDSDGRIFAFDVTRKPIPSSTKGWFGNDIPWGGRDFLKKEGWCYELPFFWRPPAYNQRIPAQHSGFLVGGVPKFKAGGNMQYRKAPAPGPGSGSAWRVGEVRKVTSVPMRMTRHDVALDKRGKPTFTFRISGEAKREIRIMLEDRFGIRSSTMYPDSFGMAIETKKAIEKKLLEVDFS
ncbi:FRG domain-containing protein [Actinomyces oris]|uniref:FRG domain-containing protein n=1 Tax=Actinomyces oris TaxID=544580 RepID=UPI0015DF86DE|nr:FRG domain-containing protein [Actinomyces oris]